VNRKRERNCRNWVKSNPCTVCATAFGCALHLSVALQRKQARLARKFRKPQTNAQRATSKGEKNTTGRNHAIAYSSNLQNECSQSCIYIFSCI
jgi:hypothetical protein